MKKGFSLIELLIYVSIFAVAGGMMFGILALILKVNQRESSTGEITSQLNFVSQTLSRLIRSSSNVEIDAGIATSTLKLRMKDQSKDPTCIYLDDVNGIIKLAEGPDTPFNLQNCAPNTSDLTNDKIKVDKLEFIKSTQYPGHDSVSMNIQMSYNSPNPGAQATREIKSASMRFSTAEFDGDIFPSTDGVYDIGTSTARWRNAALSGNMTIFNTATTTGNLSIGTTTIANRLYVADGNITQELKSDMGISTINTFNVGSYPFDIYVSGKYAYVTGGSTSPYFKIIDISNPNSPAIVGSLNFNQGSRGIYVSGRYAYVTLYGSSLGGLQIIDISNPSAPTSTAFIKTTFDSGALLNGPFDVYVSGRYAYIVSQGYGQDGLSIVDIANPQNPIVTATTTTVQGIPLCPNSIYVARRYAYITGGCAGGGDPEFSIIDVSNPKNPKTIGSRSDPFGYSGIYISGRYAYTNGKDGVGPPFDPSQVFVIDIANPGSPQIVGTTTINSSLNKFDDIFVAGRYAYVVNYNEDNFSIIDISNPTAPKYITYYPTDSPQKIYIAGHYAYITNYYSGTLSIIDISGLEAVSANIHSLEAGNLQVRNDIIAQGQLQITGGINVGTGGIFSAGPIGVSIASTTQTDAISAYLQGRVGIATTTPQQALEVNGGIRLNPVSESRPVCDNTTANTTAGTLWHNQSVNDELQICAASSTNYAWRNL